MKEPKELDRRDLILPSSPEAVDDYYTLMKKYSFRLVLRDIIKRQDCFRSRDLTRFASTGTVRNYLKKLQEWEVIERLRGCEYRLPAGPVRSFGLTLEWFTSEVLRREFGADTLWGVRFSGTRYGGDYDVIALMEGILCYLEVKSSPPKHIEQREVEAFFNRIEDLLPNFSVFMVDTELRMKDKLVPMFEDELERRFGKAAGGKYTVERMERELFRVRDRVYLINSKKDIEANLRVCVRAHLRLNCCL
jgi:hypothetical protein